MTVAEMIRFTAAFYPRWRADLEQRYLAHLRAAAERSVKALSRGTRTKLALLLGALPGAELLILDEPTAGLDPAMTEEILQALVAHVGRRSDRRCSSRRIRSPRSNRLRTASSIIHRGRAVVSGALDDLRERFQRIQLVFDGDAPDAGFRAPGVERVRRKGRVLSVLSSTGSDGDSCTRRAA